MNWDVFMVDCVHWDIVFFFNEELVQPRDTWNEFDWGLRNWDEFAALYKACKLRLDRALIDVAFVHIEQHSQMRTTIQGMCSAIL